MKNQAKLGIVILNYKTYEMTLSLIKELNRLVKSIDYSIIVVDNASPNESVIELENSKENFILIKNSNNSGYAAGNNLGIKYAINNGMQFVLVMNNDIIIHSEEVILKMIHLMESNEDIAAISPRIIDAQGRPDPPIYYKKPTFWDLSIGIFSYQRKRFKFNDKRNAQVYAPRGSFMLLRSKALEEVNLLDEHTFLYYEEPILSERLDKHGYECWHFGEDEIIHNHAATISKTYDKRNMAKMVCQSYRYYLKQYREFNSIKIIICVMVRYFAIMIRR